MSLFIKRDDFPLGTIRGACYTCNGVRGPLVDIQMQVDFEGYIVFCNNCAKDIGEQAGMVDGDAYQRACDLVDELEDKYMQLKAQYSIQEDVITSLRRYDDVSASKEK